MRDEIIYISNRANSLATAEGNNDNDEEDINEQKEQFIQVRKTIQEKVSHVCRH